jgi:hypothetical protein
MRASDRRSKKRRAVGTASRRPGEGVSRATGCATHGRPPTQMMPRSGRVQQARHHPGMKTIGEFNKFISNSLDEMRERVVSELEAELSEAGQAANAKAKFEFMCGALIEALNLGVVDSFALQEVEIVQRVREKLRRLRTLEDELAAARRELGMTRSVVWNQTFASAFVWTMGQLIASDANDPCGCGRDESKTDAQMLEEHSSRACASAMLMAAAAVKSLAEFDRGGEPDRS